MTPAARARLVILTSSLQEREYVIGTSSATIGRNPDCEIILDEPSVSRRHAVIEATRGVFRIRDLGSRNGVKVGDRLVAEAELRHGDVITIGQVRLRFELPEASAAPQPQRETVVTTAADEEPPRPLTSEDILALAQPGAAAEAEARPHLGINVRLLAILVLALLFSAALGVALLKVLRRPSGPGVVDFGPVLVRVGENKWMTCRRYGDFDEADLVVEDESVADARKYDTGEFVITGRSGGNTNVSLLTDTGVKITLRVLVRGRLRDPLEELAYARMSPDERRRRARQFLESGLLVEKEKPYLALQEYRKAVAVLKPLADRGELYIRAKRRMNDVEKVIDARWQKLRGDITVAWRNNDVVRQMALLKEAMKLIPDPNDPRHQKAQWRYRALIQEQLAERERRRRP